MRLQTRNFGELEFEESKKIVFKEGLPGFEKLKEYIIIEDEEEGSPFCYLQSIEDGDVCLIMAQPHEFKPDYAPLIGETYFSKLGGGDSEEFTLLVVVNTTGGAQATTINLLAPVLIHRENRLGVQVILDDKMYHTKHKLLDLLVEREG